MGSFTGARDLYKTGILGTVSRVEQNRNSQRPYWMPRIKDVDKKDVDWKEFLMDVKDHPFDPVEFSAWYGFLHYSDGPTPQWGSHYIDLVHYITGASFPTGCFSMGGVYTWKDEHNFTCPDHVEVAWEYPEGFLVNYATNMGNGYGNSFKIYGDQGVLKLDHWSEPVLTAEGGSQNKGVIRGENPVEPVEMPDHFLDWLQCIRNRKTPNASIDAGYQHAVAVIMASISRHTGRKTVYDPGKRKIEFA
jgi:predicted dehydrogenase